MNYDSPSAVTSGTNTHTHAYKYIHKYKHGFIYLLFDVAAYIKSGIHLSCVVYFP